MANHIHSSFLLLLDFDFRIVFFKFWILCCCFCVFRNYSLFWIMPTKLARSIENQNKSIGMEMRQRAYRFVCALKINKLISKTVDKTFFFTRRASTDYTKTQFQHFSDTCFCGRCHLQWIQKQCRALSLKLKIVSVQKLVRKHQRCRQMKFRFPFRFVFHSLTILLAAITSCEISILSLFLFQFLWFTFERQKSIHNSWVKVNYTLYALVARTRCT